MNGTFKSWLRIWKRIGIFTNWLVVEAGVGEPFGLALSLPLPSVFNLGHPGSPGAVTLVVYLWDFYYQSV